MKKSVLLGIAAVALLALPAFSAQVKYEGWEGYWTWIAQPVKDFPVKLKIPWFIKIVNEKDWELVLVQETDCDFPCFRKCKQLQIACNFNLTLECQVTNTLMGGDWSCWYTNPGANIDMPGGNTDVCVQVKKADLLDADLQSKTGQTLTVATLKILCKPR
jgi:hypothetical protein